MEKIDKDYVLKVADLAKLSVEDSELIKYQNQLSDIMTEINKIDSLDVKDSDEVLLSPSNNLNDYMKDGTSLLSKEDVLREATNKNEDYIIVPKVIE